jgi:hypothetical protein
MLNAATRHVRQQKPNSDQGIDREYSYTVEGDARRISTYTLK